MITRKGEHLDGHHGMHRQLLPPERLTRGGRAAGTTHSGWRMEAKSGLGRLVLHGTVPNGRERARRWSLSLAHAGDDGAVLPADDPAAIAVGNVSVIQPIETVILD